MAFVEVDRIIDRHGRDRASLIAVLQDIQDAYNWVSEEHLGYVADRLALLAEGRMLFRGTPDQAKASEIPRLREFLYAYEADCAS